MSGFRLDRFLELLTSPSTVWGSVAGGFALLGLALLVLMVTRLGQSHPLRKCVILSVLTHVLLAAMLSTVHIAASTGMPLPEETDIKILTSENFAQESPPEEPRPLRPWERFASEAMPESKPMDLERAQAQAPGAVDRQMTSEAARLLEDASLENLPEQALEPSAPERLASRPPQVDKAAIGSAEPIETQQAVRQDSPQIPATAPVAPERQSGPQIQSKSTEPGTGRVSSALSSQSAQVPRLDEPTVIPEPRPSLLDSADRPPRGASPAPREQVPGLVDVERPNAASAGRSANPSLETLMRRNDSGQDFDDSLPDLGPDFSPPRLSTRRRESDDHQLPGIYKLRVAPDRSRVAERQGGTRETEAAVNAALEWLSRHQAGDGRWDASQFGAGREDKVLGHDRQGAGARADTGVSGLALLAFLGAGHTHLDGGYQQTVARGLEFLMRSQGADGNLAGNAELYAAMYCHGMATIALSEAYGMTHDERLERPLRRALAYTLSAQHPTGGGWRYKAGDRVGDTSQLGWQLMALKSAKLAGIDIPAKAEEGMVRFLKSVTVGDHGGLASYRIGERASATMTAEALVCRNFLGMPADSPAAAQEAGDLILSELPGQGRANLYYWYYATLAMHHLQGDYWDKWNAALRKALVDTQRSEGPEAGSWDVDTVWGGYGGRVYTTAMGALCLEVYYRFLPLYERPLGQ